MKHRILTATAFAVLLAVTGCSSTKPPEAGILPGASATTAISDQLAVNDFTRYGVKISYGLLSGELESVEAIGYAPVWGNSASSVREAFRVAELEAKKSLNDFINRENITSKTSVKMISHNLEQAKDNKKNNFMSNVVKSTDDMKEIENEISPSADNASTATEDNTASRNDALKIASTVNNTITTQNAGILSGLYLVKGEVVKGGRNVVAVYRWDKKSSNNRPAIRAMMMQ